MVFQLMRMIMYNHKNKLKKINSGDNYKFWYIKTLFTCFIKDGKKTKLLKNFYKINLEVKGKFEKPILNVYENSILNLRPLLDFRYQHGGSTKYKLPFLIYTKKPYTTSLMWFKRALQSRVERSFFQRFAGELFDLYNNKGSTIKKKHLYYQEFFQNKAHLRFLRFFKKGK